jgi:hypothetical protein
VFSTYTCLIHLTDYKEIQMDKGVFDGMILLDLQKAFDTVDYLILLIKFRAGLGDKFRNSLLMFQLHIYLPLGLQDYNYVVLHKGHLLVHFYF